MSRATRASVAAPLWVLSRSRIAAATAASISAKGTETLVKVPGPLMTEIPVGVTNDHPAPLGRSSRTLGAID
jgi:hypothetical protein